MKAVAQQAAPEVEQETLLYPVFEGARALQAVANIAERDGSIRSSQHDGFPLLRTEDLVCLLRVVARTVEDSYNAAVENAAMYLR